MPVFIKGLRLSDPFYEEIVKPVLVSEFAGLVHSAALIGYGSEVWDTIHPSPLTTSGVRGCSCS